MATNQVQQINCDNIINSEQKYIHLRALYAMCWAPYNECKTIGFMDGLGNNGFANPIISSCLEISSVYNPFSSRFLFPVVFIIVALFIDLTACIIYHPFYHLVTMHVCKTVGIC